MEPLGLVCLLRWRFVGRCSLHRLFIQCEMCSIP